MSGDARVRWRRELDSSPKLKRLQRSQRMIAIAIFSNNHLNQWAWRLTEASLWRFSINVVYFKIFIYDFWVNSPATSTCKGKTRPMTNLLGWDWNRRFNVRRIKQSNFKRGETFLDIFFWAGSSMRNSSRFVSEWRTFLDDVWCQSKRKLRVYKHSPIES